MKFKVLVPLLFISLLSACGENKDDALDEELKQYEKEEAKTAEEAKKMDKELDEKVEKELDELDKKAVGSDNNVYGAYSDLNAKPVGEDDYYDKEKGVRYLTDNGYIYQIEKDFDTKLGINMEMDSDFVFNHISDFMEKDAVKVQDISDKEFVYESKKINKKYYVTVSTIENNVVQRIIVSQNK